MICKARRYFVLRLYSFLSLSLCHCLILLFFFFCRFVFSVFRALAKSNESLVRWSFLSYLRIYVRFTSALIRWRSLMTPTLMRSVEFAVSFYANLWPRNVSLGIHQIDVQFLKFFHYYCLMLPRPCAKMEGNGHCYLIENDK